MKKSEADRIIKKGIPHTGDSGKVTMRPVNVVSTERTKGGIRYTVLAPLKPNKKRDIGKQIGEMRVLTVKAAEMEL